VARVLDGEPHIGQSRIGEMRSGVDERVGQQLKSLRGQGGEQTPPIGEVVGGRDTPAPRASSRSETLSAPRSATRRAASVRITARRSPW
jgi:hypothetical protein